MGHPAVKSKSRIVVPHRAKWSQRIAARFVFVLERILTTPLRWEWQDNSGLFDAPEPIIYCLWHNRLALSMTAWRKYPKMRQSGRRMAALVSASKDGALLARILENFGVEAVRGSTSRRGPQALLELTTWAERGYDLAITPDGPRGPRYVVQEGVIALAQLTGLPILPVIINVSSKICTRGWDRFQIPLPFARCEMEFAAPIRVPRHADDTERETLRRELEETLRRFSRD